MSSSRSAYGDNEPGHLLVSSIHGAVPSGTARGQEPVRMCSRTPSWKSGRSGLTPPTAYG
ncbi:hypothetical protein M2271_004441 [Streptomyces sp. LBL]|nr:hypothetical protein [Streptomyces sp. LBL]